MQTSRTLLVLILSLLAVRSQADDHTMECFTAYSMEKQESQSFLRLSCSRLMYASTTEIGQSRAIGMTEDQETKLRDSHTFQKRSRFVFAEVDFPLIGDDSRRKRKHLMIGVRQVFLGQKLYEPFVHVAVGGQRQEDDAGELHSGIAGLVGAGIDFEFDHWQRAPKLFGIVPVFRIQGDAITARSNDAFDGYGRFSFGLSFRWNH